jgi:hypothetical protein
MTKEKLISRLNKLSLEKVHAKNPNDFNLNKYKMSHNVFNPVKRKTKKLNFKQIQII